MPALSYLEVFVLVFGYFLFLYFSSSFIAIWLTKWLIKRDVGKTIDDRPLRKQQYWQEIRYSILSIFIFSFIGIIVKYCLYQGWITIQWEFNWLWLPLEIMALFFWNEIHFYLCHRLLHTRWLYKHVHYIHHLSTRATPFSTYSFHWFEALSLGSVMITALLFYDFSYLSLAVLPIMSILLNVFGHINYDVFPHKTIYHLLSFSRRHSLHHRVPTGNFGFLLTLFDRLFKTEVNKRVKT